MPDRQRLSHSEIHKSLDQTWLKLLLAEDVDESVLRERDPAKLIPPLYGALLKNEQDVQLFEKLAFLRRREGVRPGV